MPARPPTNAARGFTLTELLVVIGIIAVLLAALLPVVASVRTSAQATDTAALVRALDNAARTYYADFTEYPGAFPVDELGPGQTPMDGNEEIEIVSEDSRFMSDGNLADVTGTENLVLSLIGGLKRVPVSPSSDETKIVFDHARVGRGALNLQAGQGQVYRPYVDLSDDDLSLHLVGNYDVSYAGADLDPYPSGDEGLTSGRFVDESGAAQDSEVPEFVDRFTNPMPILYLRANPKVGRDPDLSSESPADGRAVYYLNQVAGYVLPWDNDAGDPDARYLGVGRENLGGQSGGQKNFHGNQNLFHGLQVPGDADDENGFDDFANSAEEPGPYDADVYLQDRGSGGAGTRSVKADSFILISPGPDRVYGSRDDITNFGSIGG